MGTPQGDSMSLPLPVLAIESCQLCSLHKTTDKPLLITTQPSSANIMIVLSRPYKDDDLLRSPFASFEGKYLKKLLTEAGLIDKVYLTYMNKCYPGKERVLKHHIDECKGWLWKEIQAVEPTAILMMGQMVSAILLSKNHHTFKLEQVIGQKFSVAWTNASLFPCHQASTLMGKNHKDNVDFLEKLCLIS
jgi:uracil-DNA glycosylase family 4